MLSQLARIASIHMVDEIVIVKDHSFSHRNKEFSSIGSLTKILQYLETPQYLRKALFPISSDLKYVGRLLLSRTDEPDREQPPPQDRRVLRVPRGRRAEPAVERRGWLLGRHRLVQSMLFSPQQLKLDKNILPGTRVTAKIHENYLDHSLRNAKCNRR